MLLSLLKNPAYAGAFAYGRRIADSDAADPWPTGDGEDPPAAGALAGLGQGRLPGVHYVGRARANSGHDRGEPTEDGGTTDAEASDSRWRGLLTGLVRCGRCGHSMQVAYKDNRFQYICRIASATLCEDELPVPHRGGRSTRPWCRSSSASSNRLRSTHSKV